MSNLNLIQMISYLNTLSIPSFYDHADVGQALPFIAIHTNQPMGFRADNGNYQRRWEFRLDLYTVEKSLNLESEIDALLDILGIPWEESEQYLNDQSCWEIEYTFDILGLPDEPTPDPEPTPTPDPDPVPEDEDNG